MTDTLKDEHNGAPVTCLADVSMYNENNLLLLPRDDISPGERRSLEERVYLLPERRYNRSMRAWQLETGDRNIEALNALFQPGELCYDSDASAVMRYFSLSTQLLQSKERRRAEYTDKGTALPTIDFEPKTKSMKHQLVALDSFHDVEFFALLMDMGLGKTKVVIDEVCWQVERRLQQQRDQQNQQNITPFHLLVVCPRTLKLNWQNEFRLHKKPEISVWYDMPQGGESGIADSLIEGLKAKTHVKVWCLNPQKLINPLVLELLQRLNFDLVVVDESTMMKNPYAKTTKALHELAPSAKRRVILTGSLSPNSVLDIWSQFQFLRDGCLGFAKYDHFRSHYAYIDDRTGGSTGVRNYEELKKRMSVCSFIARKHECLDLPEKQFSTHIVAMSRSQAKIYTDMAEKLLAEIEGATNEFGEVPKSSANIILVKLLRLAQITSGFAKSESHFDALTSTAHAGTEVPIPGGDVKYQALNDLLDEMQQLGPHQGEAGRILIWTRFKHDVRQVSRLLQQRKIAFDKIDGETSDDNRFLCQQRFNSDEPIADLNHRLRDPIYALVCDAGTAGFGLNLVGTAKRPVTYSIYFSSDFSLTKRLQSQDRCHRIGMHRSVQYIDIVCGGTVDEYVLQRLADKQQVMEEVLDTKILKRLLGGTPLVSDDGDGNGNGNGN